MSQIYGLEVGTGGAPTIVYLRDRGGKGYAFVVCDPDCRPAEKVNVVGQAEYLEHIRSVFGSKITDLAGALGVSRQAIYDWHAGKQISAENFERVREIARAADLLLQSGFQASHAGRRKISEGKNFFEIVRSGGAAEIAARGLIEILKSEQLQRKKMQACLAGRAIANNSTLDDVGAPFLNEGI